MSGRPLRAAVDIHIGALRGRLAGATREDAEGIVAELVAIVAQHGGPDRLRVASALDRARAHADGLRRLWREASDDTTRESIGGVIASLAQPGSWRSMTELADDALDSCRDGEAQPVDDDDPGPIAA